MNTRRFIFLGAVGVLTLLDACSLRQPRITYNVVEVYITATTNASPTPTKAFTPTITSTPTPTPTPTPTALPISLSGDPRAYRLQEPFPQSGAPCGVVDLLDFPLHPPDGEDATGGRDFGVFRNRYDKFHTGEDWGMGNRSSFGTPVYSIGHGVVTYAQPLGWGADKGVVIVRHVTLDGPAFFSFYGHLDPDSATLHPGDCVVRGEQVGKIGKPRRSAHLHFELRYHMPTVPGPGYWSVDPTLAGWSPPSQSIWDYRIRTSPGVVWNRPLDAVALQVSQSLDEGTLLTLEKQALVGIDVRDGAERWRQEVSDQLESILLVAGPILYTADQQGRLEALRPNGLTPGDGLGETDSPWESDWTIDLDAVGIPRLIPLPDGGVALAASWDRVFGVSSEGQLLWEIGTEQPPFAWALDGNRMVFTTENNAVWMWESNQSEPEIILSGISGIPLIIGDDIFIYDADGVYHLDPSAKLADQIYALPPASPVLGDIIALPDGNLMIAHSDIKDQRLIVLDRNGNLRWERSYGGALSGRPKLSTLGNQIYLMVEDNGGSGTTVAVYQIESNDFVLSHLFTGGSRASRISASEIISLEGGGLLISVAASSVAVLDPQAALTELSTTP